MNKRADRLAALLVDAAIDIAAVRGVAAGAQAPDESKVRSRGTHRVLLYPGHRRRASYLEFIAWQASNRSTTRQ